MGKSTGFIEYMRELPPDRPPLERVKDWNESHPRVPDEVLMRQGARGMASGCPLNNLIPDWNDLVYRGQWQRALRRLLRTNNFPEFTGRVCPAPCEGSCTVALGGDPVTIKAIEVSIIDKAFEEGWIGPEIPQVLTGKTVAIVGSGPAGLACAAQLNRAGHTVTVFERADRVGGLLMYGIPNMKLDKRLVDRRVGLMARNGVRFVTGVEIGRGISSDSLLRDYHATVLCCGSTQPRDLDVEGRQLQGVHQAMDFLTLNTKSLLDSAHADGAYISAKGKNVVVIGGGDTGTDCVGTALRHGARSVTQLEILAQPPEQRAPDNPWPQWPKVNSMDYGQEEAAALQGADPRTYGTQTLRFTGEAGSVQAVQTVGLKWSRSAEGRMQNEELPDSERVIPADLVLLALGFLGPERKGPITELGLKLDGRGNVVADGQRMTSIPGVFAAGDMVRGQSLVVWAIHEGRNTARSVDRYLMYGKTYLL